MMLDGDLGKLDDVVISYLERVYKSTNVLIGLVNDMLDISKIESEKMTFSYEEFEYGNFLEGVLVDMRQLASNKNIIVSTDMKFESLDIYTDIRKLTRVLVNIIGNAIKFTGENGNIHVTSFVEDKNLHIAIRDTGVGISEENLPYIFEKFSQIDNPLTRNAQGSGLGLSISKRIMELLGGEVLVESEP